MIGGLSTLLAEEQATAGGRGLDAAAMLGNSSPTMDGQVCTDHTLAATDAPERQLPKLGADRF